MPDLSTESDTTPKPKPCVECSAYMVRRVDVLADAIAVIAFNKGISARDLARRYMWNVHRRHLAGISLDVS